MILQALTTYYEDLVKKGKISSPGWGEAKVSYALVIDREGNLTDVISMKTEQPKGKKTVLAPQNMRVPAPVKRSVGIVSNFLCDHSGYVLGVDDKGNPKRTMECFEACKRKHIEILEDSKEPAALALTKFFNNWNPVEARSNPALSECWDEIVSGVNIVFRFEHAYIQDNPNIGQLWEKYYMANDDGPEMVCLITGIKGPVEKTHPAIKGIRGAQSSGAALISFNASAFCSYGKEQNYNAPVSQFASFAYTTALNYLISDKDHLHYMGDTAVLCWAEGGDPAYQGFASMCLYGASENYTQKDILDKAKKLAMGQPVEFDDSRLNPGQTFYFLGIAPNAARLSVRFFYKDSFGSFLQNINEHHQRMEIERPQNDKFQTMPLWRLLYETVNTNSKDKEPSPVMAGEVMRSILTNTAYPATLLNGVTLRIRAEHNVTPGRAAIIKGYYLKNESPFVPKEVLQVALNKESTNIPYNLGRLFAVLENIQSAANPGINTTIKDRYFNSASATPGHVFPVLINLSQKHLSKIGGGLQVTLNRDLSEILDKLGEEFPARLNLQQQGSFQLGYYHQRQARFQGKKEEE